MRKTIYRRILEWIGFTQVLILYDPKEIAYEEAWRYIADIWYIKSLSYTSYYSAKHFKRYIRGKRRGKYRDFRDYIYKRMFPDITCVVLVWKVGYHKVDLDHAAIMEQAFLLGIPVYHARYRKNQQKITRLKKKFPSRFVQARVIRG